MSDPGWILEGFRAAGLFTAWFDRYKALITLSVILRFGLIWFLVPGLSNETECTPMEMLRSLYRPKKEDKKQPSSREREDGYFL